MLSWVRLTVISFAEIKKFKKFMANSLLHIKVALGFIWVQLIAKWDAIFGCKLDCQVGCKGRSNPCSID